MQDFRNLRVWHKAHQLTLDMYALSANNIKGPAHYVLRDQITRAAISVPQTSRKGAGGLVIGSCAGS